MPVTVTSSHTTSVSLDLAAGAVVAGETTSQTLTTVTEIVVADQGEPEQSGSDALLGVTTEATAIGEGTLALTEIDAFLAASEYGSWVTLDAEVIAAAAADEGELVYTTATTSVVTGASQTLISVISTTTETASSGEQSLSVSTSQATLIAMSGLSYPDVGGMELTGASGTPEEQDPATLSVNMPPTSEPGDEQTTASWTGGLDGNIAIAEVDADALGLDSLVDLGIEVLTLEDSLSIIVVDLFLAAG